MQIKITRYNFTWFRILGSMMAKIFKKAHDTKLWQNN